MLFVHELLRRCARNRPEKIAYYCRNESRSWRQVDQRSERFASALQNLGVRKGAVVGILSRETFEIYEHFFACSKLGAIRVGINWRYAAPQILHILEDSKTRVLLVQAGCAEAIHTHAEALSRLGVIVIGFGPDHHFELDYETLLEQFGREPLDSPQLSPVDSSLYTFTSGSTGKPKGVVLSYGAVAAQVYHSVIGRGMLPGDIVYVPVQSSWVAFLLNAMGTVNGMSHVIVDGQFEIVQFLRDIERLKVTAAQLAPTLILRAIRHMQSAKFDLSSLRLLMYGSAPATPALIKAAKETFQCQLHQSYGSTETGWVAYLYPQDHDLAIRSEPGLLRSAGHVIPQCMASVRDENGRELPPGHVGEIWLTGETLMTGYLNQPELTAEVMRDGWVRTNDIGRIDDRGYLYLLDRRSFMIVTGGVNVFPANVEAVLSGHDAIEEVAVVGVPHEEWGEAIAAAVKVRAGVPMPPDADLRRYCEQFLSKPECPKTFRFIETMPRNENGKIDKSELKRLLVQENIQ